MASELTSEKIKLIDGASNEKVVISVSGEGKLSITDSQGYRVEPVLDTDIVDKKFVKDYLTNSTRLPTQDENDALQGTGIPSDTDRYVNDSDPRNTNARTPTSHASNHLSMGSDPLLLTASGFLSRIADDFTLKNIPDGKIILGNSLGIATAVTPSGDATLTNTGIINISSNVVTDSKISSHTTTKISTTNKLLLNPTIVYNDQVNAYGNFSQTFKDNSLSISNPTNTAFYTLRASAIAASRQLILPLTTQTETLAVQPQTFQSTILNPASTLSLVGVMMGLSGSITPRVTGKIMLIITGDISNSANNKGSQTQIRVGTGIAPINGAVLTGVAYGGLVKILTGSSGNKFPFTLNSIINGLTLGTSIWLDISLASITGGTSTVADISISCWEL